MPKYYYLDYNWDSADLVELKANNWDEVPKALADIEFVRRNVAEYGYSDEDLTHLGTFEIEVLEVSDTRKVNFTNLIEEKYREVRIGWRKKKEETDRSLLEKLKAQYETKKAVS